MRDRYMPWLRKASFTGKREMLIRYGQRISLFILVIVPVLMYLYMKLHWGIWEDGFPMAMYLQVYPFLLPSLAVTLIIYWAALVLLIMSAPLAGHRRIRSIIIIAGFIIGLPMCLIWGVFAISTEIHSSSAQMDQNRYYGTILAAVSDWPDHILFKCDAQGLNCKKIFHEVTGGNQVLPIQFIVDQRAHEIHFFMGRWLMYTDGPQPHAYEPVDLEVVGISHYYLIYWNNAQTAKQEWVLTRCDGEYLAEVSCAILPFRYATPAYQQAGVAWDESAKEIRLLIDGRLVMTYDSAPHCQAAGCAMVEP